jgi:lysophospholipase L1-like esterase
VVNTVDLLWALQAVLGSRTLTTEQEQHGDVAPLVAGAPQPDGVFNLGDVVVITRLVLGGLVFSVPAPPANQFNIGDSIGEGEAANGTIGQAHHENVWSTGYAGGDGVNAFNERYETIAPDDYYENNSGRDPVFNQAVSGAVMADFAGQAQEVVSAVSQTPSGNAGRVTMLLGNNDVCADSLSAMTDPAQFEAQYRAGLDVLAASEATRQAQIHVSGIPAIYWLWNAKRGNFVCRVFIWPFVPCQNLLDNPADDCASGTSRNDPDNDYPGDGSNCQRRKQFHRLIRDTYNPILHDVLEEYRQSGALPNARYIDIYDVKFGSADVNDGDCFHPSRAGHALLADTEWCRTALGAGDPQCAN